MGLGKLLWPFKTFGKGLKRFVRSRTGDLVISSMMTLFPVARPIVEEIKGIVGNPADASVKDILKLYRRFGFVARKITDDPVVKGNALLNLASQIMRERFPSYDTPLIQIAINMALMELMDED